MDGAEIILHHLIDDSARRWPDQIAVSTTTEALTHREVADASIRAAAWLRSLGVARGQRVVLAMPSNALIPVLIYATSRIGAVFCVLHEQAIGRPLAHVLTDAEPALLIAADERALALAHEHGVPATDVAQARRYAFGETPTSPEQLAGPLPVDPLCLIYTSGTTTEPKAVVSTHQQAMFAIGAIQSVLAYRADDIVYCPLPMSFDYGMYQLFLGAASGAHIRLGTLAEAGPVLSHPASRCPAPKCSLSTRPATACRPVRPVNSLYVDRT